MLDIIELLRSVIWGLMNIILNIIDVLWNAAKLICGLDFSNSGFNWLWNWFVYIELFFMLFLVFRICKVVFKAFTDEEYMQKLNPSQWLLKMAVSVIIMSAVPFIMKEATSFVSSLVDNIGYFTDDANLYNSQELSTLLVDSSSIELNGDNLNDNTKTMRDYAMEKIDGIKGLVIPDKETFKNDVKNWSMSDVNRLVKLDKKGSDLSNGEINKLYSAYTRKMTETVETATGYSDSYWVTGDINAIDINEGEEDGNLLEKFADTVTFGLAGAVDKIYYMYPSWSSLFFGLITVIGVAVVFLPILLQMAQRTVSMVIKLFLAPYAVSSLIDPESNTYSTWCKYMISDLISNWFQLYGVMLLFAFIGSSTLDSILKSGTVVGTIAKMIFLIGGLLAVYTAPSGVAAIIGGSEMSAANTLSQMQGLMAFGMGAAGLGMGAGKIGLSAAGGAARAGKSFAGKIADNSSLGNKAKNAAGAVFGSSKAGGTDGFGSSGNQSIDDLKPSQAQSEYASSLGVDGTGMNRGELADAVKNAGGSGSVFESLGSLNGDSPANGAQLDYASSLGVDGTGMTACELSGAVESAGGSLAVMSMLGDKGGVAPTGEQISYAKSLGIEGAANMSRSELGKAVMKNGGNAITFNHAGGMRARDAIAVNRASMMNTRNIDRANREKNRGVGNFIMTKAAGTQIGGRMKKI